MKSINRVFVESSGLKPYCDGSMGMYGFVSVRINCSTTLDEVQRRVMGR